ncbi:MAG: AsmA-like C-terminal domain-containing protein [Mariprofundaceae bacterium]
MTVLALMAWVLLPDINRMRPQIETLLKQQLQLRELKLQDLSWYWAGQLGFKAGQCSFQASDSSLAVQKAQLNVSITVLGILQGELWPKRIRVKGGSLQLDLDQILARPASNLVPVHVVLRDMHIAWNYNATSGELADFSMDLDLAEGKAKLDMPGLLLQASLDKQGRPISGHGHFEQLQWLPKLWQGYVSGKVSGDFDLQATGLDQWELNASTQGKSAIIDIPTGPFQLPFDKISISSVFKLNKAGLLERLELSHLEWVQDLNHAEGTAEWKDGKLVLKAKSEHVDMPLLWSWLRPLSQEKAWHDWLARMRTGFATDIQIDLDLPWQQLLTSLPSSSDWQEFHYRVQGRLHDSDLNLGIESDMLFHTQATVDLNEIGLHADVSQTELPFNAGLAHGELYIPWQSLMLDIQGQGEVDVGKLQAWLNTTAADKLGWEKAAAHADFKIQWDPAKLRPEYAHVSLNPASNWKLSPKNINLEVESGQVEWDIDGGLTAKKLRMHGRLLHGEMSFHIQPDALDTWQFKALDLKIQADLPELVDYYNLPVESAAGTMNIQVSLDGKWHGRVDFKQASWANLLGAAKAEGEALQILYQGKLSGAGNIELTDLVCQSDKLQLNGHGSFNSYALKLSLDKLKSPAFDGSLNILAPFGSQPWEMDMHANYLNRKALPKQLPNSSTLIDKAWSLNAEIASFVWDDANMSDVSIKLASKRNSAGVFKAKSIDSGSFTLKNVAALFALPGAGHVDLRQLSAQMDEQKLTLSASLQPEQGGGMRWRGFAQLQGNFGQMMQRANLSSLFKAGEMQALFLGQGVLLRDQPWWQGLRGRVRLRADNGTLLKGGTLTKTLAAFSLSDLPALFFGKRDDLTQEGLYYRRLQIEGQLYDEAFTIHELALRSSAMDIAGKGELNLATDEIDFTMVARPFQNLDAVLAKLPLLRDLLGGAAHSLMRKVYHMHGPVEDAEVDEVSAKAAGLSNPGLVESLFSLPGLWFGEASKLGK